MAQLKLNSLKLKIAFKQINSEYSQDYADEYQFGEESVDNQKYHWSVSFEVKSRIDKISILKSQNLHLVDQTNRENPQEYLIDEVTVFECYKKDELYAEYAVSDKLIEKIFNVYKESEDTRYCYFYLKDKTEYVELRNHIYVLQKDIRKLIKNN